MPVERTLPPRTEPVPPLRSHRGTHKGKSALARETRAGSWQVKVHDPTSRLAGHDGWVLLGSGWATLDDARTATGLV